MSNHTREELIKHLRRSISGMERAAADMLEADAGFARTCPRRYLESEGRMSKHTRGGLVKWLRGVAGLSHVPVLDPQLYEDAINQAADMLESDGELIAAWERAGLTPPKVVEGYRAALERITNTRFSGSCCGCSGDDGFDAVQEIAVAALAAGREEGI